MSDSVPVQLRATDGPPRALVVLGVAMFAGIGLVMLRWTRAAVTDDNLPTALVAGLGALSMIGMVVLGVSTNFTRPEPRVDHTPRGLEIRPALYVSKLVVFTSVAFVVAMALGAVLYATGGLDFHPGSRSDRRFADKMFGLALALPFIIGIPYLPAIRTWISGERKPWHRNPAVLLSAEGAQIERLGVARFVAWDQIADVAVVKNRYQPNLVITRHDGPALVCERLPLLGGSWLLDTVRNYWLHPQERSRLGAAAGRVDPEATAPIVRPGPRIPDDEATVVVTPAVAPPPVAPGTPVPGLSTPHSGCPPSQPGVLVQSGAHSDYPSAPGMPGHAGGYPAQSAASQRETRR